MRLIILSLLFIISTPTFGDSGQTIYKQLEQEVQQYKSAPSDTRLTTILKKYIVLFKLSDDFHNYNLIYPIYKKNPQKFKNLLKQTLSKQEQKIILFNLQGLEEEYKRGNDF